MTASEIDVHAAQAWLASSEPPRLIDVREEEEWSICRLPGAELIPLSRFAELAPQSLPDQDEPLLIYCHHGVRSARVAEYLAQNGFKHVTNLAGGIAAWAAEINPDMPRY